MTHFPQTWSFLEFLILFGSDYRISFGIKKKESHISNFEHNQLFTLSALLVHCTRKDSKPGHDVVWNYMTEALFLSKDEFKLRRSMYWRLSIRGAVLHIATKEYRRFFDKSRWMLPASASCVCELLSLKEREVH